MLKKYIPIGVAVVLSACAAKPPQVSNAQYYFDSACHYALPAIETAKPLLPSYIKRLNQAQQLAILSGVSAVDQLCSAPLDLANAAQLTQRVYDIAGQVIQLVLEAQKPGAGP